MTAAQTEHEGDKHTAIPGIRKEKIKKVGSKAQKKQENRTQGVHRVTNLPVSGTKPSRRPCHTICHLLAACRHTICHLLPALVGNGIKCQCSRCRPPPPAKKSTKTTLNCLESGAVATQVPLISRTGALPHDLPFHFCIISRQQYQ